MNTPTALFTAQFRVLPFSILVAAAAILPPWTMVATNSSGHAVLAADAAGLTIAGLAAGSGGSPFLAPNYSATVEGGPLAGPGSVCVERGIFRLLNSSTHPVTATELGKPVFVEDEQPVSKTTAHSVVAGVVVGLDAGFVWLVVGPVGTLPGQVSLAVCERTE